MTVTIPAWVLFAAVSVIGWLVCAACIGPSEKSGGYIPVDFEKVILHLLNAAFWFFLFLLMVIFYQGRLLSHSGGG